jgi:hypothetical protein
VYRQIPLESACGLPTGSAKSWRWFPLPEIRSVLPPGRSGRVGVLWKLLNSAFIEEASDCDGDYPRSAHLNLAPTGGGV